MPRNVVMLVAALGVCSTPTSARAEDVVSLSNAVSALATTDLAAAARLAAAGAARGDLDNATRVLLGGLAFGNFKRAFEAEKTGGNLADLCGLADVMRLVAPLEEDKAAAQLKLDAAAQAEARLKAAAGEDWRRVCDGAPPRVEEPVAATTTAPPQSDAVSRVVAAPTDTARQARRFRAGVGTLVSGLVLSAPLAGVLVYRYQGEQDFARLRAVVGDNRGTEAQQREAEALNQRHRASTAAAAVLGVAGAALVVTGAVLMATGQRRSRVAVVPWGARGVGGLVLHGRF